MYAEPGSDITKDGTRRTEPGGKDSLIAGHSRTMRAKNILLALTKSLSGARSERL
jgi:hypothetical protein